MYIPFLYSADQLLTNTGFQPMGPKGKNGLPIFLGRYLDDKNRIRILAKPRAVVNPINKDMVWSNQLTKVAYAWNKFAS